MNAFFIILAALMFVTLSPMLIAYTSVVSGWLYFVSRKINYLVVTFLGLVIYWPESMVGQAKFLSLTFVVYIACFFYLITLLLNGVSKSRLRDVVVNHWYFVISLFLLWLYVYVPILSHTYLNLEIFTGRDVLYISTDRSSHMLSFSLPMFLGIICFLILSLSAYQLKKVAPLFRLLKVSVMIYIGMSLFRYALNFDFIPQNYTEVRYDGYRLSGFANPDPNGYARSLLVIFALVGANVLEKPSKLIGLTAFALIVVAIFMSGSRTTLMSLSVASVILLWLCLPIKKARLTMFFIIASFGIFLSSGLFEAILYRNGVSGAILSGRYGIYLHVISILIDSPWVGLRPGGWMEYLASSVNMVDGIVRSRITTIDGTALKIQSTHSFYLEVAINWGLPMLFVILLMSLSILRNSLSAIRDSIDVSGDIRDLRSLLIGLAALICAIHVHGVFENIPLVIYFGILGISAGVSRKLKHELRNSNLDLSGVKLCHD